jgi:hypothetical protein
VWHYLVLAIGIAACLGANVFNVFRIKTIMKAYLTTNGRLDSHSKTFEKIVL